MAAAADNRKIMTLNLSTILSILFILILVGTVVVILTDEKSSSQKLVWILLIAAIPVVGLLLYILMGIDFRRPGYIQRNHKKFFSVLQDSDEPYLKNFVSGVGNVADKGNGDGSEKVDGKDGKAERESVESVESVERTEVGEVGEREKSGNSMETLNTGKEEKAGQWVSVGLGGKAANVDTGEKFCDSVADEDAAEGAKSAQRAKSAQGETINTNVIPEYQPLVKLLRKGMASPVSEADDLKIFTSGQEKLESLMADIRAARKYIHMEYFYFRKGRMGTAFRELLMQKAREGVKVRFIRENIANFDISPSYYNEMKKAGVEVVKFTPTFSNILGLAAKLNYRDHRKIVVIDGEIAYTGGMNISDDYYDGWRDTHLRFTGEAVAALQMYFLDAFITSGGKIDASFSELFPTVAKAQSIDIQRPDGQSSCGPSGQSSCGPFGQSDPRKSGADNTIGLAASGQPAKSAASATSPGFTGSAKPRGVPVQLVPGDPDTPWPFLTLGLVWILNHAKKYVWLQSPYFMPPESLLDAIKSAALRGVDVRVMMPRNADIGLLTPINRSYYLELLRAGVRIFRNDGPFIHSKTFVSDDYVSMVGSCNLDYRSLELSYEMNTYMYGPETAAQSRAIFERDMDLCTEIFLEDIQGKHRLRHLWDSIIRLLAPLL